MNTTPAPEATPIPGQVYQADDGQIIVPIYTPEQSEAPDHRNGCLTARYAAGWGKADTFAPTGWFVYYSHLGGSTDRADHRGYFAYGQLVAVPGQTVEVNG